MADKNRLLEDMDPGSVAFDLVPIAPNDNADLTVTARAIRCTGSGGALRVTTWAGNVRDTTISAGEVLGLAVTRVHDTGTDATGLEALL